MQLCNKIIDYMFLHPVLFTIVTAEIILIFALLVHALFGIYIDTQKKYWACLAMALIGIAGIVIGSTGFTLWCRFYQALSIDSNVNSIIRLLIIMILCIVTEIIAKDARRRYEKNTRPLFANLSFFVMVFARIGMITALFKIVSIAR